MDVIFKRKEKTNQPPYTYMFVYTHKYIYTGACVCEGVRLSFCGRATV